MRLYKGWIITRNDRPGYALRWTASKPGHIRPAADTLAGIKRLITHYENQNA